MAHTNTGAGAVDVLIAGGRTTGLVLGIQLLRNGLTVRIVDHSPGIDPHSRATLVHSRSLELLKELGITDEIVAHGQELRGIRLFADGAFIMEADHPPVSSSFPFGIAYSQAKIERLLEAKLEELGGFVERNTTLLELAQDGETVSVRLGHEDGSENLAHASWLVGCDGAHSTTRHLLQIGFPGEPDRYPYILADVLVDNDAPPHAFYSFLHEEGPLYFFILDGGRRLVTASLPEDHPVLENPSLEELQALIDRRSGGSYRISDPRWLTCFRINYRVAEAYRSGRVFLAGDAAHVNSLVGGHGMNTGMQDACNLAWKLALVKHGFVSDGILDSYDAERRPVAHNMVAASRAFTEPSETYASLSAEEKAEFIAGFDMDPDALAAFRRSLEELDIDYSSSPICQDTATDLPAALKPGLAAANEEGLQFDGADSDLFSLLTAKKHTLLVFKHAPMDAEGLGVPEDFERQFPWINVVQVTQTNSVPDKESIGTRLFDPNGDLTACYGMETGGFYLIRPDGYIAARATTGPELSRYLKDILKA